MRFDSQPRASSGGGKLRLGVGDAERIEQGEEAGGVLGAGDGLGVVADEAIAARQRGDELGAILEAGAEDEADRRSGSRRCEFGERGKNAAWRESRCGPHR